MKIKQFYSSTLKATTYHFNLWCESVLFFNPVMESESQKEQNDELSCHRFFSESYLSLQI